jgi:hypothetical protein
MRKAFRSVSIKPTDRLRKACALFVLALSCGCSATGGVQQPAAPELVTSEKALVVPPPGGPAVRGVIQKPFSNGVEQTVLLATTARVAGQNYFRVQFLGEPGSMAATSGASYTPISDSSIAREVARAIPGVRLARTNRLLQNGYGPFSYATGSSAAGDTCVFAWQQIRSRSTPLAIGRNFGMIQVRMRLCDMEASERQLLNVMYGYTLTGTLVGTVWNPHGVPRGADEDIISGQENIYPGPRGWLDSGRIGEPRDVTTSSVVVRAPARVVALPAAAAPQPADDRPQAVPAVMVPLPDTSTMSSGTGAQQVPRAVTSGSPTTIAIPLPGCTGGGNASSC